MGLGGGADLPADWLPEVPVPEGNLISVVSVDSSISIIVEVAGPDAAVAALEALKNAGFTVLSEGRVKNFATATLENGDYSVPFSSATHGSGTSVLMLGAPME